jgi:hypothetical protein
MHSGSASQASGVLSLPTGPSPRWFFSWIFSDGDGRDPAFRVSRMLDEADLADATGVIRKPCDSGNRICPSRASPIDV